MHAAATRMTTEQQLVEHVARLARKTEALDDFAGLVAHDVKTSLLTALLDEDPRAAMTRALELVDSILEAVRTEQAGTGAARLADCVQQAIADLGDSRAEIVVSEELPGRIEERRAVVDDQGGERENGRRGGHASRRIAAAAAPAPDGERPTCGPIVRYARLRASRYMPPPVANAARTA